MKNIASLLIGLMALAAIPAAFAQDGTNINQAIPIYFGQTISDTIDASTRSGQVYSIALSKGQQVTVTGTGTSVGYSGWAICLESPTVTTVASSNCVAGGGTSYQSGYVFSYQVATAGTYYVYVHTYSSGSGYQLQVAAQGTPVTTNPPQAGCLTGQVDYITYSLQLVAAGLPDTASIGGTQMCSTCTVKPPAYPLLVTKMENAMGQNVAVSACYDNSGNVFQLKLIHP